MAPPKTRAEFKSYCLRRLGAPVVRINGADAQFEDRIDDALQYYADYHYNGTTRWYFKYKVDPNDYPTSVKVLNIDNGGVGYSNTDTLVFSQPDNGTVEQAASANVVTDDVGKIIGITWVSHGSKYSLAPEVSVTTSTGSGAVLRAELGGFIDIPDDIQDVIGIFDVGSSTSSADLFSARYQFIMNEMYALQNFNLAPYYMQMQKLNLIQQVLVGKQPIRYNRNTNRLYIDMDWSTPTVGAWIIIECYMRVDPEKFPDVWKDRFLLRYGTALIKRQYGENLKKFGGVPLVGGQTLNGQQIYDEAVAEIEELEQEMLSSYSAPSFDFIG